MKPSVDHLTPESRRWRTGLLLACAFAIVLASYQQFLCTPLLPYCASAGFALQYHPTNASLEVTGVTKAGPAAIAGLRIGDRIFSREVAFRERRRLYAIRFGWPIPVGERLSFVIHRGARQFTTIIVPRLVPPTWRTVVGWVEFAIQLWALMFAALLASRRPDLVQARLLSLLLIVVFSVVLLIESVVPWVVWLDFVLYVLGYAVFGSAPIVLVATFAAQFARPISPKRRILTAVAITLAGLGFAVRIVWDMVVYLLALPDRWLHSVPFLLLAAGYIVALTCAIAAAVASRGAERQRAIWATVSFGPYFIIQVIGSTVGQSASQPLINSINALIGAASLSMPVGLTYAVLSRRVVDIGYVVNRAAVFTGMSVFVLGIFVIVEWALSAWVSNASHTTSLVVNVAVALGLGLSLRYVHTYVERSVDRVFFRKRHDDEAALRRFAHESSYITDRATLLDRTVRTVEEHTSADDAAIFVREGAASYVSASDGERVAISENDPGIVALRAWGKPLHPHDVTDSKLQGELAFPMISRGALVGVLVCGPKRDGEAYAPDESEALLALAHGVGTALDTLSSRSDAVIESLREIQALMLEQQRTALMQIIEELRALPSKIDRQPPPSATE